MAHAQKPDFAFCRNGRVHLNRQGRQFGRLLAAEMCASALVMLDTARSEVVWQYWLPTQFASFPFTSPPMCHRVSSGFKRTLPYLVFIIFIHRLSQEEWTKLRESVPYVKLYRYNPKHLYPKLNGYGDNGHREVCASGVSTYCKPSVTPYSSTAHARQRETTS